jgi:ataxia telangiectasia mutated family protein
VIRLCSLWFANFDDEGLQEKVRAALDRIPSRKFIFLSHQLSARMSKSQTASLEKNQENLQALIMRMCEEHPFHSLYQVYCLRPERTASAVKRHSSRLDSPASQSERGAAARDIFDRLRDDVSHGERVRALERICDACLEWARFPIRKDVNHYGKKKNGPFKVPETLLIRKIEKIRVPVMTASTPLDPTLRYDNCIWIERYETTFETAGGNNLPKISVCYGNNGERYKQLVCRLDFIFSNMVSSTF